MDVPIARFNQTQVYESIYLIFFAFGFEPEREFRKVEGVDYPVGGDDRNIEKHRNPHTAVFGPLRKSYIKILLPPQTPP